LSKNEPVVRDVADDQRASFPVDPPDNAALAHFVVVPVDVSTCPNVPVALIESKSAPARVRLVVEAFVVRNVELAVPVALEK
jgi:hypothetical protein